MEGLPTRRLARLAATCAALTVAAGSVAACGSSDGDTTATTGTGATADDAGLRAAQAVVSAHEKSPAKIGPQVPIKGDIPAGKTIAYVNCGLQICMDIGDAMTEAAGLLGWEVDVINADPTPEGAQAAFTEAVRQAPDAVAGLGFSRAGIQRQLDELEARGTPVAIGTGIDPSDPAKKFLQVLPPSDLGKQTRALADKMIVDAGGQGTLGIAFLTGFPGVKLYSDAWRDEIAKNCPRCEVESIDIAPSSIGKDAAAKIANWLRANPDVKHLFLSYDDFGIGLSSALKNAGIDAPKTYGQAPTEQGMAALESGERTAAAPGGGVLEVAWVMVDAFARMFAGESIEPDLEWGDFALWSEEYGNLPTSSPFYQVPDYKEQFAALWGK